MRNKQVIVIVLMLFTGAFIVKAQINGAGQTFNLNENLAAQYYNTGEFDKAAELYKTLLEGEPTSTYYYDYYLNCLLKLKDYANAEKEIRKLIKKNKDNISLQVDLGYIYGLNGEDKNSKAQYDKVVENMDGSPENTQAVAEAFLHRDLKDYAIKTYLKSRKLGDDKIAYAYELADLYQQTGDNEKMVDEYLALMEDNTFDFNKVKERMQEAAGQDATFDILRKQLLKKIQAEPDNFIYADLLTWLFVQRKDFNAAFIQAKSLDRKLKEGGRRLVDLANIALDYHEYDLAEKIYQAVLDQGQDAFYFIPAQKGMLDLRYVKITQTSTYTPDDIKALQDAYGDFINKYGMARRESGEVVMRLAEVDAQYAGQVEKAIDLLKLFVATPGIDNQLVGQAKLALGDYSLLTDEVWESTLYYSQVEKMFKDAPLGHEAKFRNAKLSFYRGDFEWAQAQLEVLKGSTSELIANDALQLSLEIQDNLGTDSTSVPLTLFAEADFLIFQNHLKEAEEKLDTINKQFPSNTLDDYILMERAEIALKKHDYPAALAQYEKVYTNYKDGIFADDALYKAAQVEENNVVDVEKAKALYEKLLVEYKGSVYAVEARTRFRILRGDAVN